MLCQKFRVSNVTNNILSIGRFSVSDIGHPKYKQTKVKSIATRIRRRAHRHGAKNGCLLNLYVGLI
jgi:hypothetical protein